jgi:signal peptidase II
VRILGSAPCAGMPNGDLMFQSKKTWVLIALLIAADQGVKLFINANFLGAAVPIAPPVLYFKPVFNTDYSWFASMLDITASKWLHVVIVGALLLIIILFYRFLNSRIGKTATVNSLFAFLFSGALCSLVDKVFWNGSLDFIMVNGLFTFDTKDVYISVFIGLVLLFLVQKNKTLAKIGNQRLAQQFFKELFSKKQKTAS